MWLLIGVLVGGGITLAAVRARLRTLTEDASRCGELERELVGARGALEHERVLAAERVRNATASTQQLADSFKSLSAETLQASMQQLTQMARAQLQAAQAEAKGDLDKRQNAVEQLVAPLKEQLGRVDAQLVKLDQQQRESRGNLHSQLRTLAESNERLRTETGALVTALRKPNARGRWGQVQLRKVVEMAGMVKHCDFVEQFALGDHEVALRPDLVVKLPGGKHVVIDAKAPLQGLLDAYEARDEEERERHMRDHSRLLRKHVKALSEKAYWSQLDSTPDFVVLFLPAEHLYGAALEADPTLIEDAMARQVLLVTPTTLLALLHAVAQGWQQERVTESARAISELGRELHARIAKLSGLLATLGKRLNSTVSAYNETVGSYEARVLPGAKRFTEHGAGSGRELVDTPQVTLAARGVYTPEPVAAEIEPPLGEDVIPVIEPVARRLRAAE
ncbi:MAG: DNA recombination protein RmuC [Solirubrobacteraceae bacterium]